jgi:protocatechuate 3,4-dioxygenase beta subunit
MGYFAFMKNLVLVMTLILFCALLALPETAVFAASCPPTEEEMMGPFYKPDAPPRSAVGTGYALTGMVRSSKDCSPIPGAVIELWLAGPGATGYDDAHRATIGADSSGAYRFESNIPPPIEGRPPHIHLKVTAKGYVALVTQHYPIDGQSRAVFDVVLVPSR